MSPHRTLLRLLAFASASGAALAAACDTESPTMAVVDNAYPALTAGAAASDQTVVYRVWWGATYFETPVPASSSSSEERAVPVAETAYALLAPGWDPSSETPPTRLVAVRSREPVAATRGSVVHIEVDDRTFVGNCGAGEALSQDDADLVTQRLFPGPFVGATYDAKTCTTTRQAEATRDAAGADGG